MTKTRLTIAGGIVVGIGLAVAAIIWKSGSSAGGSAGTATVAQEKKSDPAPQAAESHREGKTSLTDKRRLAAGIEIVACERRTMPELIRTTGTVEVNADRVAHLGSRLPGIVLEVADKGYLGTFVNEGDPLAVIHSIEFGKVQVEYRKSMEVLQLRQKTFTREKELYDRRISSGREFVEAEAELARAKIDVEAARNELAILGLTDVEIEAVAAGKAPLGCMNLRAPLKGVVIQKHLVKGEHVDSETTLFSIADLDRPWLFADIYERDLGRIAKGQAVEIHVSAYPERVFTGRITHLGETMNVETRTLKVRVETEDREGKLKPGMFASVDISIGERIEVASVPEAALQMHREHPVVFVELERNMFEQRRVRTGVRFGGFVEILEGVEPADKVVTTGSFLLKSELEKASFEAD